MYKYCLYNIEGYDLSVLFNNGVCSKKMLLLNVNNIGQNMGGVICRHTDCDTANVLVSLKGFIYQTD